VLGGLILTGVVVLALAAPVLYPETPFSLAGQPLSPPFGQFPLGTDTLGRDVAAGIVYGARTSLLIGVLATAMAVLVGTVLGSVAGYYGGSADDLLMRVTEFFQTIPSFVIAIAVVSWPAVARLVRGQFLSMREREFVQACVGLGMSDGRIMLRHILPNCLSPVIVLGSLMVATAILIESGLSFLGLADPNVMSWGFQVGAGRGVLRTAWWLCAILGIAILLTVLGINLVGEGLNDALNPRLRQG